MEKIRLARLDDASAIAHVHIESWRTTYKDIVPDAYMAAFSYEKRTENWEKLLSSVDYRTFVYVAVDEQDRVVGFVHGGKPQLTIEQEYGGELYAIYLLEAYQGHGIGRLLTQKLVESLIQVGIYSMFLWVLKDNSARRFYESLGGQLIRTQPITIGGAELEEVAYGWKDIRDFFQIAPEKNLSL